MYPKGRAWAPSLLLDFLLLLLSLLFLLPSSRAGEMLDLCLLCYSPGTAAQSNSFNYHTQSALSYHRGCAAPSVFPSWLCREDRHLPKVSWSASLLALLSLFPLCLPSVDLPYSFLPPPPAFFFFLLSSASSSSWDFVSVCDGLNRVLFGGP